MKEKRILRYETHVLLLPVEFFSNYKFINYNMFFKTLQELRGI